MKKVEKLSEGTNYTAATVGQLSQLGEYVLPFAPGVDIPGKVFVGQELKATGSELSFQSFAPHTETGFLHTHKTHEELYIFTSGTGEFQVDGQVFPISEGSLVRVAPDGKRSVRNNGDVPLVMICMQYKANSFDSSDATDGVLVHDKVEW